MVGFLTHAQIQKAGPVSGTERKAWGPGQVLTHPGTGLATYSEPKRAFLGLCWWAPTNRKWMSEDDHFSSFKIHCSMTELRAELKQLEPRPHYLLSSTASAWRAREANDLIQHPCWKTRQPFPEALYRGEPNFGVVITTTNSIYSPRMNNTVCYAMRYREDPNLKGPAFLHGNPTYTHVTRNMYRPRQGSQGRRPQRHSGSCSWLPRREEVIQYSDLRTMNCE